MPANHNVYLGLGSNLGDRVAMLGEACRRLALLMHTKDSSPIYETEPIGCLDQPWFLNQVIYGVTGYKAETLLELVKTTEQEMGRILTWPNGPRVIDIDILFYDTDSIQTEKLVIPHPRLSERLFVLQPLLDIAPELYHPTIECSLRDIFIRCQSRAIIRPYVALSSNFS